MLKIRLQRIGREGRPVYRIVVAEHTAAAKGKYIALLGRYDPLVTPKVFELDPQAVETWVKKGAKPSSTIARILKGKGVKGMEAFIDDMPSRKKKKEPEVKPATAVAAPAEQPPAEQPPAEQVSAEQPPAEPPAA
ncbi:30S ribosomal protein S16 [Candidatus Peregrinibacteria bacterium]|nr:30S ribosomal protein S16 [Candidatus Peregrinibacteria bacterium]